MNRQIVLAEHPKEMPTLATFRMQVGQVQEPKLGEVLVAALYLSVDPYMRGRLGGRPSSHPPFALDRCISGDGLGKVIQSKSDRFSEGDIVTGHLDWADYSTKSADGLQKVVANEIPLTAFLGPLGMTGMTAYFGMIDIGKPKLGETVCLSGAGGAVGMFAAAIAKSKGCSIVGITGSDDKALRLKEELGFDAAVNYKSPHFLEELSRACPNGIDVYFDNVGGAVTDAAIGLINKRARIVLSGQISTYNSTSPDIGLRPFRALIVKSALAQGFVVWDYKDRFHEGMDEVTKLIKEGKMKWHETLQHGIESLPKAFLGLFSGENFGKQLIKLNESM